MRVLCVLFVLCAGCSVRTSPSSGSSDSGVSDCEPPETAVVICEDADPSRTCFGLPNDLWCHPAGTGPPSNPSDDCPTPSDASFPLGCRVILPSMNPYWPCGGQHCTCMMGPVLDDAGIVLEPDGAEKLAPGWSCPL